MNHWFAAVKSVGSRGYFWAVWFRATASDEMTEHCDASGFAKNPLMALASAVAATGVSLQDIKLLAPYYAHAAFAVGWLDRPARKGARAKADAWYETQILAQRLMEEISLGFEGKPRRWPEETGTPPRADAIPRAPTIERAWWSVLGVSYPCTLDAAKRAFRSLAKTVHPDHGGTAEEFMRIKEAYDQAARELGAA